MAFKFSNRLTPALEQTMRHFYETLCEKDRRRFSALQAQQLGHGGIEYLSTVLGCSRRTIERGLRELAALPEDPALGRVRRAGSGRKKRSSQAEKSSSI